MTIAFILLFLFCNISFTSLSDENSGNLSGKTLYVGGSGPGNYSKIQDAIDVSNKGDTVFVYKGIYYETVVINDTINLIGEDRDSTIIFGDDQSIPTFPTIVLKANNCKISGFTITNSSRGILLWNSSNNSIMGNRIKNSNYDGLVIAIFSSDNIIQENIFINDSDIYLSYSLCNLITDNNMHSNGIIIIGDRLDHWESHIIENNVANGKPIRYYKNLRNIVVPDNTSQIILANCTNFTIRNLNLSNVDTAIQLGFSSNNIISSNKISKNDGAIFLTYSSKNIIFGNSVSNNLYGIVIDSSSYNNLIGNKISNNSWGITLRASSDNNITGNCISDYLECGIRLFFSSRNNISYNNVYNSLGGYQIWGDCISLICSSNNCINGNNLSKNDCGVLLESSTKNTINNNNIDDNWWGVKLWVTSEKNSIVNNTINNNRYGISIEESWGNIINGNSIFNNFCGIHFWYLSNDNLASENEIFNNELYGIFLDDSSENSLISNNINNNHYGAKLAHSSNNVIYNNLFFRNIDGINLNSKSLGNTIFHNDLIENSKNAVDSGNNTWFSTYDLEGNFWDDYSGQDENDDGIGDIPYLIQGGSNQDKYPLKSSYVEKMPPRLEINTPDNAIYVNNYKIISFFVPIIIGPLDISVVASDNETEIKEVIFEINECVCFSKISPPYVFNWNEQGFGKNSIKITAIDCAGNTAIIEKNVWRFF